MREAPPLTALRYLGLVLWGGGRLDEAASVMTKAVSMAPDEPVILGELGSLLRAVGRKTQAMHYLTASLKLDPKQSLVWLNAAGLCNEAGDKTSAEHAFRAALELDSTRPRLRRGWACSISKCAISKMPRACRAPRSNAA
jgi:Flp pilus assembly protein TadD